MNWRSRWAWRSRWPPDGRPAPPRSQGSRLASDGRVRGRVDRHGVRGLRGVRCGVAPGGRVAALVGGAARRGAIRMTCRVIAAALVLMTVFGARTAAASEDDAASDELALLAAETGVDPVALAGAVDTVGVPPRRYLEDEGLLQRPTPTPAASPTWPIGGALGQRLWCIEG